jgi:hypothetical protein
MSIARFFQGKSANFADLDVGTATALASRSTPAGIRKELLQRADAGEIIRRDEVKERLAAAREAQKLASAAARVAGPSTATGLGDDRLAAPRAFVDHLNADEFVRLPPPIRPLSYQPALAPSESGAPGSDSETRKIIDAMLELAAPVERLSVGGPAQIAKALLAAGSEQDLTRVQKLIGFAVELKQAIDDADARCEPDLRRAS